MPKTPLIIFPFILCIGSVHAQNFGRCRQDSDCRRGNEFCNNGNCVDIEAATVAIASFTAIIIAVIVIVCICCVGICVGICTCVYCAKKTSR